MPDVRFRSRPALTVVLPLLLTLGVTAALAWSAWSARREHRRAAEETARDYARFAATIAASNVDAALEQVMLYAFYGAYLAERQGSAEPVPPSVLATNAPEAGRCADRYPGGRWFARVAPDGGMDVEGPLPPGLTRWLADTLVALQAVSGASPPGNLFPPTGADVVAYRVRRDSAGRAVEAHALAHCFESGDGPVFDEARRRTPLLPPTAAGSDSLVALVVTDPRGRVVHRSGRAGEGGFVGLRPADASGPLEGLRFSASVPVSLADALVAGGIPAEGSTMTWLLALLAACLGAATLVQVHRSVALVRARERFVASVSHELRTPLQLVLMFAQLLRLGQAKEPAEREEALGIIEREARRLIALVERVLAYTGSGSPVAGEARERVDLVEVASETVDAFRPMADAEAVALSVEIPDALPPVRGSASALRQVLLNLLDNAVRHGPPGQRVVIRAAAEDGRVDLMVDDQGPGIPSAERERVWQPFRRLEGKPAGRTPGSGIGLAVVREAVEAMGGRAWIEDGPGSGTRVVVRLPVATDPGP